MLNWGTLQGFIVAIIGIGFLWIAAKVIFAGDKKQAKDHAQTGLSGAVAIIFAGIGLGAIAFAVVGPQLLALFGINLNPTAGG